MSDLELTTEEFDMLLWGLGSLMQDRSYSPNRQWEARLLAQKLHALKAEGDLRVVLTAYTRVC